MRAGGRVGRRIYDEAVRQALVVVWETADRICGKWLKAVLPSLVESMERHGHLRLDEEVKRRLLAVSAATIDRLLAPVRDEVGAKRRRHRPNTAIQRRVPIRTFGDWGDPAPGFFEADLVAHCGGVMAGSFVHTLVVTDIASGWTDGLPLLVREQKGRARPCGAAPDASGDPDPACSLRTHGRRHRGDDDQLEPGEFSRSATRALAARRSAADPPTAPQTPTHLEDPRRPFRGRLA